MDIKGRSYMLIVSGSERVEREGRPGLVLGVLELGENWSSTY